MKFFTKAEITGTRAYFEREGFEEVQVNLGEREFSYFVVPQSLELGLPNFVMLMTGDPDDGYVLGISDSVDPVHRQYAVAHEYIEFVETQADVPNRCTMALDEELRLVPDAIKPGYVAMRLQFFTDLIGYCSGQPELYTEDDIGQFRENAAKLESLMDATE